MNIHQKILKIADMAGVLQRSKDGYGYKYVPEEDIQAKVTAGMQKYGLMLYDSIVPGTLNILPITYEKYDAKAKCNKPVNEIIVSAESEYTWVNVDNPEEKVIVPWIVVGQMADASQAFGAGATYCNRYFLMKSLQLATTEQDPDNYRSKQAAAETTEERLEKEVVEKKKNEIIAQGHKLIEAGAKKTDISKIVAEHNNGNGNPSSITKLDVCEAILAQFKEMKKEK